jgi:hypothetical protein
MNSKFEFEIRSCSTSSYSSLSKSRSLVDWIVQGNALHNPRMFEGFKILVEKFESEIRKIFTSQNSSQPTVVSLGYKQPPTSTLKNHHHHCPFLYFESRSTVLLYSSWNKAEQRTNGMCDVAQSTAVSKRP